MLDETASRVQDEVLCYDHDIIQVMPRYEGSDRYYLSTPTVLNPVQRHKVRHFNMENVYLGRTSYFRRSWASERDELLASAEAAETYLDFLHSLRDRRVYRYHRRQADALRLCAAPTITRWIYTALKQKRPIIQVVSAGIPDLTIIPGGVIGSLVRTICFDVTYFEHLDYSTLVSQCPQLQLVILAALYIDFGDRRQVQGPGFDSAGYSAGLACKDDRAMNQILSIVSPSMRMPLQGSSREEALIMRQYVFTGHITGDVRALSVVVGRSFHGANARDHKSYIINTRTDILFQDKLPPTESVWGLQHLYDDLLQQHIDNPNMPFGNLTSSRWPRKNSQQMISWESYTHHPKFPARIPCAEIYSTINERLYISPGVTSIIQYRYERDS